MIARRCIFTLVVFVAMLTWPSTMTASGTASGGTTVSVQGDTVNITVNIDLVLDKYLSGSTPVGDADRQKFGGLAKAISDYWNTGLASYPYHGCLHLHVNVVLNVLTSYDGVSVGYPFDASEAGHHLIHWVGGLKYSANEPNGDPIYSYVRPTVYDPTRPPGQPGDFPSPYETGLPGDWSPALETTRDYAHEVGHLMGVDDDYQDVNNGDGTWSSKSTSGREGTLMDSGDAIDQNLADRLGDVIGKAGIELPTCWTGTMTSSTGFAISDGTPICAGTWTTKVTFVAGPDGTIDGTADATLTQLGTCPHPAEQGGFHQAQQIHSAVTGTATVDQLRINYVATGPTVPADGIENTGYSASIFGVGTPQPPLAVAIVSPGRAQGEQSLQLTAGSGIYTSDNTLDLTCQEC